nr:uncharacterized protein LOC109183385 [Ipomoea batatas]
MSCIQHDGIFTSIKVSSFWYKNDPYVLASQTKHVFYLNDPKLGLNWRVVQQFQHRHIYDENEVGSILDDKGDTHDNNDVYQDNEIVSSNGITIGLSDDISTSLHRVDVESHIVEAIIVPFERIEAEEDFVISDDEDESPIEYDRYEMTPGQSKKRSKFSSTAEVTNGISLTTNTKVMGSTTFLPRSNLEVNNTQSLDQLNQSMSSSLSPDATPNTDGGLSKKKPCRGPTRGFGLVKRNEVAGKKLQVVVDVEHVRPLNRIESAKLSNELGQIVRDYMPCPIKYSNYTKEEKNCAWERLLVFQCVENILKVRYRNYKHALHKEFLKYNSATEAKLHVPKGLTTENWNELCDYWSKGDVQMAQVTKTMAERPWGALPSTIENNPRERVQAITLRSGKELPDPVLHKGSTSKSPIEEENVKVHVEESAEQNISPVAPNFELVDNNLVGCVNDESLDFDEFDNVDACACDSISAVENDNACLRKFFGNKGDPIDLE